MNCEQDFDYAFPKNIAIRLEHVLNTQHDNGFCFREGEHWWLCKFYYRRV